MGPRFGDSELSASYEPFNGDNKCRSYANYKGYRIPQEDGKNALTNQKGTDFTITELEVWSIKEMVKYLKILIYLGRMMTERKHRQCILLY